MSELNISIAQYAQLVELVYEGVEEEAPWSSFLKQLAIATHSLDASLIFSVIKPEPDYYLLTSDEKFNMRSDNATKQLLSLSELLHTFQPKATTLKDSIDEEKFYQSELYQRHLKPIDVKYMIGQDIVFEDSLRAKLSAERTSDKADYDDADKALFEMLIPHLRRAIHLREKLLQNNRLSEVASATLSKASIGSIMLNANGEVISTNHMAEVILADKRGLALVNGRLKATSSKYNSQLKALIEEAIGNAVSGESYQGGSGFSIENLPGEPVLEMVIKPITKNCYDGTNLDPAVAIYINDFQDNNLEIEVDTLRKIYGMTRCEAQVSIQLADGKSQAQAAEELNVSINTVKTHLRGIYEKLGVNNQSQVVAIINRSSARLL
jgi:DNA-binding CsgD family transcriptional regulator